MLIRLLVLLGLLIAWVVLPGLVAFLGLLDLLGSRASLRCASFAFNRFTLLSYPVNLLSLP